MASAAIKGISKILRKGLRKSPVLGKYAKKVVTNPVKLKTTPRYRTDPKTGERFLNRRAALAGIKKKTLKSEIERVKPTYIGIGTGVAGTLAYQELKKGMKRAETKEKKEKKDKLQKSVKKHRQKDKKKKEKHHSR